MPNDDVRTCSLAPSCLKVTTKDTQNAFDFVLLNYTTFPVFVWCPGTLLGKNGYPFDVFSVDDLAGPLCTWPLCNAKTGVFPMKCQFIWELRNNSPVQV